MGRSSARVAATCQALEIRGEAGVVDDASSVGDHDVTPFGTHRIKAVREDGRATNGLQGIISVASGSSSPRADLILVPLCGPQLEL